MKPPTSLASAFNSVGHLNYQSRIFFHFLLKRLAVGATVSFYNDTLSACVLHFFPPSIRFTAFYECNLSVRIVVYLVCSLGLFYHAL